MNRTAILRFQRNEIHPAVPISGRDTSGIHDDGVMDETTKCIGYQHLGNFVAFDIQLVFSRVRVNKLQFTF